MWEEIRCLWCGFVLWYERSFYLPKSFLRQRPMTPKTSEGYPIQWVTPDPEVRLSPKRYIN